VCLYERLDHRVKTRFFPERNITMSALTEATIIVEAGHASGTLIQARAALKQNRKLLILESCFQDASLTWPSYYEKRGAIRVKDYREIARHLA
jgi:DNA processing protein